MHEWQSGGYSLLWWLRRFRYAVCALVISTALLAFAFALGWGAAQFIPEPMTIKNSLGTWRATLGNTGMMSYGTITRGKKAAGAMGQICANCTMPTPEQLDDPFWMEAHLLYQTADPDLVAQAELVCDTNLKPTITRVTTLFHRIGLWFGRVTLKCAS